MKETKTISLVCVLVLVISVMTGSGLALSESSESEPSDPSLDSEGIRDWYELYDVRDDTNGNYHLENDLTEETDGYDDLVDTENGWDPIDNFDGEFDGMGYTISNLEIDRPESDHVGMFAEIGSDGFVFDLNFEDPDIIGGKEEDGRVGTLAGQNDGELKNIGVIGGSVTGIEEVGGIAGRHREELRDSHVTEIEVSGEERRIGGIAGVTRRNGAVLNSYVSDSDIVGETEDSREIGGLIGYLWTGEIIENSYAENVNINGESDIGGLVGSSGELIKGSYTAEAEVSGESNIGGLVGSNSETILDSSADADVTGSSAVGGLVGDNGELIEDSFSEGTVDGEFDVGGLVGRMNGGIGTTAIIRGSYSDAEVTGISNIGGIVGETGDRFDGSFVTESYSTGTVTGEDNVGGLIGENQDLVQDTNSSAEITGDFNVGGLIGENDGTVQTSNSTGDVSGDSEVGGLVGLNSDEIEISYSEATVNEELDEADNVGGLVGENDGSIEETYAQGSVNGEETIGGLVGVNSDFISNSYSTTVVSGEQDVGGLIGVNHDSVEESFWDVDVSGQDESDGGLGKSTEEMQDYETFFDADWYIEAVETGEVDETYVWNIVDREDYPFLTGTIPREEIFDWYDLDEIRDDLEENYRLVEDLDETTDGYGELVDTEEGWEPIEDFAGSLDGDGNIINDLYIDRDESDNQALFGNIYGGEHYSLIDVELRDVNITGEDEVGGLVGENEMGQITGSHVTGSVTGESEVGLLVGLSEEGSISDSSAEGTVTGDSSVGGLVGEIDGGEVKDSSASVEVTGEGEMGGLIGEADGFWEQTLVKGSSATGNVTGDSNVGGLIGDDTHDGIVKDSYATGNVTATDGDVGGLLGEKRDGMIENSYATGDVIGGNNGIGGLVGDHSGGPILNSYATGDVTAETDDAWYVGGLVGNHGDDSIENSYATGDVTGENNYIGGLVGSNGGGLVQNSYATGDVTADTEDAWWVGGLLGDHSDEPVEDSYATGDVTSDGNYVGGLIGENDEGEIYDSYATGDVTGEGRNVGGLVGQNSITFDTAEIYRTYSVGEVEGDSNVGGLIGDNEGTVENSFWDTETSGQEDSDGGTGKTTEEMQDPEIYKNAGWQISSLLPGEVDEDYTWNMVLNKTYPHLSWEGSIDGPYYIIQEIDAEDEIVGGESLEVTATIENQGNEKGYLLVNLTSDIGEDSKEVLIEPGETLEETFTVATSEYDSGTFEVKVYSAHDMGTDKITVLSPGQFDIYITHPIDGSEVIEEESITLEYSIANPGDFDENQTIQFKVDGELEDEEEYVEVGSGKTYEGEFTWEAEEPYGERNLTVHSEDDTGEVTVVVLEEEFFKVNLVEHDDEVVEGENLTVEYEIENTGDVEATQTIEFTADDDFIEDRDLTLEGGEVHEGKFNWTTETYGDYNLRVSSEDDYDEVTVKVLRDAYFEVEITDYDEEIIEEEELVLQYRIENIGDFNGTQNVELFVDDELHDGEYYLDLEAGEVYEDQFTWTAQEPYGERDILLESEIDQDEVTVVVIEKANFEVDIVDYDDEVEEDEEVVLDYVVENTGEVEDTQTIDFTVDDDQIDYIEVTLEGDDIQEDEFTWIPEESGEYELQISSEDDSEQVMIAVFSLYELTVNIEEGGQVDIDDQIVEDGWTDEFQENKEVDLTAIADESYVFVEWTGDYEGTEDEITLEMTEDKEITAHFEEIFEEKYDLTINLDGQGSTNPEEGTYTYDEYEEVVISVEPAEGWKFIEWTGDYEGTEDEITLEMTEDKEITAVFEEDDEDEVRGFTSILLILAGVIAVAYYYKKEK